MGKSFLLFVLFKKYLSESGIDNDHIIEIALDGIENEELRDPKKCYQHIDVMKETHLSPADEMLYPENYWYLSDVLSYVAVGARSVENQQHRLVCSGIDVPAGMKNPTSGDFSVMLNSVVAAQSKQTFIYRNWEVNTPGNPLTHTLLKAEDGIRDSSG